MGFFVCFVLVFDPDEYYMDICNELYSAGHLASQTDSQTAVVHG